MSRSGVIRTRKDGGCSICYASEDNVGKKRCCHVLDNASINVRKEKGGSKFIDISGQVDDEETTISIKASEKKIKNYISSLSGGLSKKERESLLEELRNM